jgi:ribonuclease HI
MELVSAIEALRALPAGAKITVHTDSQYVQKGMSEWIKGWKRRGWKKADGQAVLNAELWRELDLLAAERDVSWRWVRGHNGDRGNERADALANQGAAQTLQGSAQTLQGSARTNQS